MAKNKDLSPEELAFIKMSLKTMTIGQIAERLGRHYNTVYMAAVKKFGFSPSHKFTEEEDKFIIENYSSLRAEVMANILGLEKMQIYNRIRNLKKKNRLIV
jgi:hypothetical protein